VIQTAQIGDVICSTPILRALARRFPHARITVLVNPVTQELLQHHPRVSATVAIRPEFYSGLAGKYRLARLIRDGRYDVAVCLNPNVPFAVGLFWGLVPIRLSVMPNFVGGTFRLASRLFTHLETHSRERLVAQTFLDALRTIGVVSDDCTKEVTKIPGADEKARAVLADAAKTIVGIAVSSGNKLKQLNPATLSGLIDSLRQHGDCSVVLIGSARDRRDADEVLAHLHDTARIIDAIGKFTLGELPALLERLSVFVGVDSGLTYMADACATPIVQIVGPVNIKEQRPMGKACVFLARDLPCAPCSHVFSTAYTGHVKTRECIESVTVDEIHGAIRSLLAPSMSGAL
jgi:heptosyltransferase-2